MISRARVTGSARLQCASHRNRCGGCALSTLAHPINAGADRWRRPAASKRIVMRGSCWWIASCAARAYPRRGPPPCRRPPKGQASRNRPALMEGLETIWRSSREHHCSPTTVMLGPDPSIFRRARRQRLCALAITARGSCCWTRPHGGGVMRLARAVIAGSWLARRSPPAPRRLRQC